MRTKSPAKQTRTILTIGSTDFAFSSISAAADAMKLISKAVPVRYDYEDKIYYPVKADSYERRLEIEANEPFSPSEKEEIIEPEVIRQSSHSRQFKRLTGENRTVLKLLP